MLSEMLLRRVSLSDLLDSYVLKERILWLNAKKEKLELEGAVLL